jgi:hypothetical protein
VGLFAAELLSLLSTPLLLATSLPDCAGERLYRPLNHLYELLGSAALVDCADERQRRAWATWYGIGTTARSIAC